MVYLKEQHNVSAIHLYIKHNGNDGHVLFKDAHNIFYLRLYGIQQLVRDNSDNEREKREKKNNKKKK